MTRVVARELIRQTPGLDVIDFLKPHGYAYCLCTCGYDCIGVERLAAHYAAVHAPVLSGERVDVPNPSAWLDACALLLS